MFQAKRNLTGQIPFAAFATARDIFGAKTDSLGASTKEQLASWSELISKRLEGGVSASALEKRFQVQHDGIFDKEASMAEFEFFSLGDVTGIVFSTTMPFSWGSVHLNAAGEIEKPVIDPDFLSVDFDLHVAKEVGRIARKLWSTKPLSDFVGDLVSPGEEVLPQNATDEQWAQFLTGACEYNLPASRLWSTNVRAFRMFNVYANTQRRRSRIALHWYMRHAASRAGRCSRSNPYGLWYSKRASGRRFYHTTSHQWPHKRRSVCSGGEGCWSN